MKSFIAITPVMLDDTLKNDKKTEFIECKIRKGKQFGQLEKKKVLGNS